MATAVTPGTAIAFDTSAATLSPELWPCAGAGGPDLWYSVTSTTGGSITIETCGSSYDTALEVFDGGCLALVSLACNDDSCGLQSSISFQPTMGTTYLFRVGGFSGNTGTGTLLVTENAAPAQLVTIVDTLPGTWMDISGTGAALGLADDGEVDVPNTVANALVSANSCRVGSNGAVRFDGAGLDLGFTNAAIPSTAAFDGDRTFMPFWDDINSSNGTVGEIYWEEIGGTLIVQWQDTGFFNSPDTVTFQLQVHSSGPAVAQFLYQDVSSARADMGGSATIGFQSGDTMVSDAQWSFNQTGAVMDNDVLSVVLGAGAIGTPYCGPAVANSTGASAFMSATGSTSIAANDLALEANDLPLNSFGFFLTSQTQGLSPNPGGSAGNLCLGGNIGRYVGPGQIQNSGSSGMIMLLTNNSQQPTPGGLVQVMAGEVWNFQAWYRDVTPMGMATSNFTNGLEITYSN